MVDVDTRHRPEYPADRGRPQRHLSHAAQYLSQFSRVVRLIGDFCDLDVGCQTDGGAP